MKQVYNNKKLVDNNHFNCFECLKKDKGTLQTKTSFFFNLI